jgi:hypothetical protein
VNRLTRFILSSGAGLTLALAASPALAAPATDTGSNSAYVEHVEFGSPDGSFTYEYRSPRPETSRVTRQLTRAISRQSARRRSTIKLTTQSRTTRRN